MAAWNGGSVDCGSEGRGRSFQRHKSILNFIKSPRPKPGSVIFDSGKGKFRSSGKMSSKKTLSNSSIEDSVRANSSGVAMLDHTLSSLEDRFKTLVDKTVDNVQNDDDESLERKSVRMDGLEVYAVVGALTAATSLSTFDNFSGNWEEIYGNGSYLEIGLSYTYLVFAALGTMSGLHTVLVFSLVTMYGRTALGIGKVSKCNKFLSGCHSQRFRAFKTFLMSAYSFAIQTSIMIINKSPQSLRIPVSLLLVCSVAYVYDDVESVIAAASEAIFSTTGNSNTSQKNTQASESNDRTLSSSKQDASPTPSTPFRRSSISFCNSAIFKDPTENEQISSDMLIAKVNEERNKISAKPDKSHLFQSLLIPTTSVGTVSQPPPCDHNLNDTINESEGNQNVSMNSLYVFTKG